MTYVESIVIAIVVLCAFQGYVSFRLLVSTAYSRSQKVCQLLIIWLLPAFVAVVVYLVQRSDSDPRGPSEPPFGGGGTDGMIGSGGDAG
jgi:hypothetical protein